MSVYTLLRYPLWGTLGVSYGFIFGRALVTAEPLYVVVLATVSLLFVWAIQTTEARNQPENQE